MSYNPASGTWRWPLSSKDEDSHKRTWSEVVSLYAAYGAVFILAKFWLDQVTKYVPDPYLDEIFHIPQAQVYCSGDYKTWDDKITTPPGLYAFSNVVLRIGRRALCSTYELRSTNVVALLLLVMFAATCRNIIESVPSNPGPVKSRKSWTFNFVPMSSHAIHTAFNTALFPPLFFFSGLYYTDILSTAAVLLAYCVFLRRKGAYSNSTSGGMLIFIYGILSLTMRQTNIFWVAVFMAGLELVRTLKSLGPFPLRTYQGDQLPHKYLQFQLEAYGRGEIHDVALAEATISDCALCAISIAVAALCNPVLVVTRLWPYLTLLSSFAGFVIWNGGVVLGDKSNHVATIHLPQMLYIWPFFAFFSAPLLLPYVIKILQSFYDLSTKIEAKSTTTNSEELRKRQLLNTSKYHSYIASFLTFTALLLTILTIIYYNTIIHPFTLADNRHYMFYVFRYSILRNPAIKYLLSPVYLISGYLIVRCLSGSQTTSSPTTISKVHNKKEVSNDTATQPNGNDLSFALMWFLSSALSLITAPLVEPRYYIVSWVIWRLHVPAISGRKYDYRLWIETIWFLVINFGTGWVFLFKGFEWPQEPGKVQRFMW